MLTKLSARKLIAGLSFLLFSLHAGADDTLGTPVARLGLRLPPSALQQSISLQQSLHVERDSGANDLDVALEVDSDHLEMVGMAFGQRVLTMSYDGVTLKDWRHAFLPSQVRSEDILEDIQLTYWPAETIRAALPKGWRLEENDLQRTLLQDDKPVMVISYTGMPRWSGKVELANLRYNYRLTIKSVSMN